MGATPHDSSAANRPWYAEPNWWAAGAALVAITFSLGSCYQGCRNEKQQNDYQADQNTLRAALRLIRTSTELSDNANSELGESDDPEIAFDRLSVAIERHALPGPYRHPLPHLTQSVSRMHGIRAAVSKERARREGVRPAHLKRPFGEGKCCPFIRRIVEACRA